MRISSDTSAKMGAIAAVIIVAGACGIMGAIAFVNMAESTNAYQITISVETMDVYTANGHVYNVCKSTDLGDRYYNPETREFDLTSQSNKAILYMSATLGSKTNYSNDVIRTVQTGTDIIHQSQPVTDNTIVFKTRTGSSAQIVSVFLMLKGCDNDSSNGTVVDIYKDAPGESGIRIDIDMKDYSKRFSLQGNDASGIIGLLEFNVTVESI